MTLINERLEKALDNIVTMPHVHCDNIDKVVSLIKEKELELNNMRRELLSAIDSLCAELAKSIRNKQPQLTVTIRDNGCVVGYRSKYIICEVDPYSKGWKFDSTPFGLSFLRRNPDCKNLNRQINDLSERIVNHFNNHFISLGGRK
jgi:hypothetical protein